VLVDGLLLPNLIGTDALSSINLTVPVIRLVTAISAIGFWFLSWGCHCGPAMCVAGYLVTESCFAGMNFSADAEEQGAEIKHCALKTLQINVKYVKMNSLKNL
jgi:hypothetical protein